MGTRPPLLVGPPALVALLLLLLAGACASVKSLDEKPLALSPDERARVTAQVDRAVDAEAWTAAWNQAVDAGADRARYEAIALGALEDREDGVARDMFDALRAKWGLLSPDGRARVGALVASAKASADWVRAAELEILAADDPPTYEAAWAVYEETPPSDAEAVLEAIVEARDDRENDD